MHVCIILRVEVGNGFNYCKWFLGSRSVVQVYERSTMYLLVQYGKLLSYRLDVVAHYRVNSKLIPSFSAMTLFNRFSSCGILTYSNASAAKA